MDRHAQKLSYRAEVVLMLIDERTERTAGEHSPLTRFFVPMGGDRRDEYVTFQRDPVTLYGPGDARILTSLAAKRLVEEIWSSAGRVLGYATTEDGHMVAEKIREREYYDEWGHMDPH